MQKNSIIYTIIIFLLLVSNIFLFIQNQNFKKEINVLNDRIIDLQKEKNTKHEVFLDKIPEGWKEYSDNINKFKIWYPGEVDQINLATSGNNKYNIRMYTSDNNKYSVKSFFLDDPSGMGDIPQTLMNISIYKQDEHLTIDDFVRKNGKNIGLNFWDAYNYLVFENINNDITASKFEMSNNFVRYFIQKNNVIYVLSLNGQLYLPEDSEKFRTYFDQMVQSFRFIE
ncbi:hypothetical protein KKB43_03810 [Patescibacteria group bacterium]|nr:hypothetical protein [Patescibacteria group bacterium]